ncbi:hypothetical protein BHE90_011752 [Fusarium euwallaceae]|uniref:Uncharacterized protein n=5 Tax=Fusarium solani species complex TaxID=232080 RepID=A0A3M2RW21_9HYPO|nr:hypothetical protein CDV36_010897 [Fusarium kuroshium]RSL78630.1 hypothetical protein CEP51_008041 [Fusarium floridanum]RSL91005.1 hypothetical protein CDV31_015573 [Fusarium ambrosium]RSM02449.1 hypothetical protein CEP52_007916 [Fusarium oligoseptatum]RTE73842.1 hypothetical protein BHE90_011752 [Fusarium euwallaceae]
MTLIEYKAGLLNPFLAPLSLFQSRTADKPPLPRLRKPQATTFIGHDLVSTGAEAFNSPGRTRTASAPTSHCPLTILSLEDAGPYFTAAGFNKDICGLPGSRLRPFFAHLHRLTRAALRRQKCHNLLPYFKSKLL